uniref:Reverse transcriptase domain-containing protein n=1 Tax=Acanthochromis polyacanthus TaxID=80966 RepID=A0A3Q1G414_9TELE
MSQTWKGLEKPWRTAAVRLNNEIGDKQPIKQGLRQGWVLSPELFSLYNEKIMKKIQGLRGGSIRSYNKNSICCADDTVLMANSEENLQTIVPINNIIPTSSIELDQETLKQVHHLKHLDLWMTSDGRSETDIRCRVGMARTFMLLCSTVQCKDVCWLRHLSELSQKLQFLWITPPSGKPSKQTKKTENKKAAHCLWNLLGRQPLQL